MPKGPPVTRRRRLLLTPRREIRGNLHSLQYGKVLSTTPGALSGCVIGEQETVSYSNFWPPPRRERRGRTKEVQDRGEDFYSVKHEYRSGNADQFSCHTSEDPSKAIASSNYIGPVYCRSVTGSPADFPAPLILLDLYSKGATAIARTIPTNPAVSAATFLGELKKDGLPSVLGANLLDKRTSPAKRVAGEHLNYQFGIAPIVSDLKKFAKVAKTSDEILKQLRRDSGRFVRRKYRFPDDIERTVVTTIGKANIPFPVASSMFVNAGAIRKDVVTTKTRRTWFSACYTYYLDPGENAMGKARRHLQEANKLLDVSVTPEVMWNLAPWSWAADWVTNMGDVIHNLSAFGSDNLVMRYGYIMEETTHEVTYTTSGIRCVNGNIPPVLSETYRTTVKRRIRASPYGFGVTWDGFTPRQYSIIAALGISRGGGRRF